MSNTLSPLPDDINALKALVTEQRAQILSLQEQLNLALARRYAASSEKTATNQLRLFDEAEAEIATDPTEDTPSESITIEAHTRKKRGRKALPASLPRVDIVYELDDVARVCPHDGQMLVEIGDVTSEQLDIVPAKIQVLRHIRKKYACACGHCIRTAALPAQPIPNLDKPQDKYLHEMIFYKMRRTLFLRYSAVFRAGLLRDSAMHCPPLAGRMGYGPSRNHH